MSFGRTGSTLLLCLTLLVALPLDCRGHGVAGKRLFPTTFQVEDPFISDELSLLYLRAREPAEEHNRLNEMSVGYSKRILPEFGLTIHDGYQHLESEGNGSARGWENLEVGAKWQLFTSAEHEMILSVGTEVEIGGTGSRSVAESTTTVSPALFFGKGLGELPESLELVRPMAITGVIGPNLPTSRGNPTTLSWALSVQYSLSYLQSFVKDIGLGPPFNRVILVTEFPMETCLNSDCNGETTGTINPGLIWAGKSLEFGIAAQIPVNARSGSGVGVLALVHLFLDDLFPKSIGRPLLP